MKPDYPKEEASPEQALLLARIIWCAQLFGPLIVCIVLLSMREQPSLEPPMRFIFGIASAILMALAAGIGHVVRQQVFKNGWNENAVSPQAFMTGTIAHLAMVDAALIITAVLVFIGASPVVGLAVMGAGIAIMFLNFPTGKPMQPADASKQIGNFDS